VGHRGLERPSKTYGKTYISQSRGTDSGTVSPGDVDLARLIEAWPTLPSAVKAGITAMVEASGKGAGT